MKKTTPLVRSSISSLIIFYVAPQGRDSWSGRTPHRVGKSQEGPLATLDGARNAVRIFRKKYDFPANGIRVEILPGIYEMTHTLELGPEDSGTGYAPIVYAGSDAARVTLRGGKAIDRFTAVKDPAVLNRLEPAARGRVLQADLKACGVNDFGELRSRGFSRKPVPAGLELFYKGRPMPLARWPNVDYVEITDLPADANKPTGWGDIVATEEQGFIFKSDRLRRWHQPQDIWIHGYWVWDWANSYEKVKSLDPETGHIRIEPSQPGYGFKKGQRFFFQNILEELDTPGEWYLDRAAGLLYFWPPEELVPGSVVVSALDTPLIQMTGASYIEFQNLSMEACRAEALVIKGGTQVSVKRCILRDIGTYAVTIEGGDTHRLEGCEIAETGDGGVHLTGGDRKQLIPCNHAVLNCHIHHFSRWSKCYCPGILATGMGMIFRNNRLHSAPHTAILFSGNEFRIENNEIYQVCLETGDAGAIYTGRDYTFRGNLVRNNFIHHMGGVGMGTMGIYNDDCVSGTKMIGNIFYRATRAVMVGGGRDMLIENNLFVDCEPAISFDSRGVSPHPIWQNMVNQTMRDSFEKMRCQDEPYRSRYPEVLDVIPYLEAGKGVPPERVFARRNICLGGTWLAGDDVSEKLFQVESNLIRPEKNHPGLGLEQLAFKVPAEQMKSVGFQPIDLSTIGLQKIAEAGAVPLRRVMTASMELLQPVVRPLKGGPVKAHIRLTLENPGQAVEPGEIRLEFDNPASARFENCKGSLKYRLAAGQKKQHEVNFVLADGVNSVRLAWYFQGDTCYRQVLEVRVVTAWPIQFLRSLPKQPEGVDKILAECGKTFEMDGQAAGQMALAWTPRGLWMGAHIRDAGPEPGDPPWSKSCLELFVVPPGQIRYHQILLSPPGANQVAQGYEIKNGHHVSCAGIQVHYWMRTDGYHAAALIPFKHLGLVGTDRQFRVESQLTTRVANPPVYRHLRLFQSRELSAVSGFAIASWRALAEPKPKRLLKIGD